MKFLGTQWQGRNENATIKIIFRKYLTNFPKYDIIYTVKKRSVANASKDKR